MCSYNEYESGYVLGIERRTKMKKQNESSSVMNQAESLLVVSYDVHGYEREIETYLFNATQVSKEQTCSLRETYESLLSLDCENRDVFDEGTDISFEEWVKQQGIWCKKIRQYRVEPIEIGQSNQYNAYCLERGA